MVGVAAPCVTRCFSLKVLLSVKIQPTVPTFQTEQELGPTREHLEGAVLCHELRHPLRPRPSTGLKGKRKAAAKLSAKPGKDPTVLGVNANRRESLDASKHRRHQAWQSVTQRR